MIGSPQVALFQRLETFARRPGAGRRHGPQTRNTRAWMGLVFLLAQGALAAAAFDFGSLASDTATDQWLRENSGTYAGLVEDIGSRKDVRGYCFTNNESVKQGMAVLLDGRLEIQLNPSLAGAHRVTILLFEMANAARHGDHEEIDRATDQGTIRSAEAFGLAHELVEFEALRLHRQMLMELEARAGPLPKEFFYFVTPAPSATADYHLPALSQYLKTQLETGHTEHYYELFRQRRSRPVDTPR